ncbi:hypothetical protein A0J61_10355 [Choanephora cucurbitarum]|uniref:Uncharacterized protein n=1 Tax=Choanephora cucurbitarum TaxID=101091 RepID=A0A1C7MYW4_9FUNG|nr:hypothetical protein A0J61_10355 [Choanephora cucurbitarum]
MKISNEMSATTTTNNNSSMKNMMGRRTDLILYNSSNVAICLSELKDGLCKSSSTTQESKAIRCTKSLQTYNEMLNGNKNVWSMDWNGCRGYVYALIKDESLDVDVAVRVSEVMIPRCEEEMTEFKQALLNIYELREQLLKYESELPNAFVDTESVLQVYHSPK